MTQKYLRMQIGFPEKSADVLLARYETETRNSKADITTALADVLDVSSQAISEPNINSYIGLMHTLFTLEDKYGLTLDQTDSEVCLKVDIHKNKNVTQFHEMLRAWQQATAILKADEITQEKYYHLHYHPPEFDANQGHSDLLVDELKDSEE